MPHAIKRGDRYMGGTTAGKNRWTDLNAFASLAVFPTKEHAEDFMDTATTIEFDDACEVVELLFV